MQFIKDRKGNVLGGHLTTSRKEGQLQFRQYYSETKSQIISEIRPNQLKKNWSTEDKILVFDKGRKQVERIKNEVGVKYRECLQIMKANFALWFRS